MLKEESIIDCMAHYIALYDANKSNDREKVLKNTYALNELLHKKDIDEIISKLIRKIPCILEKN